MRIIKELVANREWRGTRQERNDEEFSPQRTQRAQRWGEEGERKETRLKVESPDRAGISGPEPPGIFDREIFVTSD